MLDRVTGQFLLGTPFVEINWAQGLTSQGRPILADADTVTKGGRVTKPGVIGGANWQPSAFNPALGLIFVHALEGQSVFTKSAARPCHPRAKRESLRAVADRCVGPITKLVRALDATTGAKRWEYRLPPGKGFGGLAACLQLREGWYLGPPEPRCLRWTPQVGKSFGMWASEEITFAPPITFTSEGQQVIAVWAGRAMFLFGL